MQLRPHKTCALNPQIGMKGSVVNIPIDIDDMVHVLPRAFNNLATIQIKLKRHMMHKSHYLFETIRPVRVCEALDYLLGTLLYLQHNITIDTKYFERHANQAIDNAVDFVVDDIDREDSGHVSQLSDGAFIDNFFNRNVNFVEDDDDGNSCDEVDKEVTLIDRNKEIVDNVQVIAPG